MEAQEVLVLITGANKSYALYKVSDQRAPPSPLGLGLLAPLFKTKAY